MKLSHQMLISLGVLFAHAVLAQPKALTTVNQTVPSSLATNEDLSPAQQQIAAARQQLTADATKAQAYNDLAIGLIRRNRETADPTFLKDADDALAQGLKLDSTNFQLMRTRVSLMLRRQQFVQAKELATELNHRLPDDVMTYGYLAEAHLALGQYAEAEASAQWMMNMRPNNTPALLVGAELRTRWGDNRGAIEFLNQAYAQTSPLEVEELAWIANKIAAIQIESGQADAAEQSLQRAEQLFAHDPYTMENMARVRTAQNRAGDAVELLAAAAAIDHDPHVLFELAKAEKAAGQSDKARLTLAEFRKRANDPGFATDQSRLDLIFLDCDSPNTAFDALKLAQQEIGVRQDVGTLDAYAWALYANGKLQEAEAAEQKALAVGVQNAQIFDHAGHIAQKLNQTAEAKKFFVLLLQTNPASEFAADALAFSAPPTESANRSLEPDHAVRAQETLLVGSLHEPQKTLPVNRVAGLTTAKSASAAYVFAPIPEPLLTPQPTGTAHLIAEAQSAVTRNAKDASAYAGLGAAYFQQARETGDVSDYQSAEGSIAKSLDLDSADFSAADALATMAEVCMGEHRFSDALTYAHKALALGTGDVSPFAIVGDAYADIGEYDKAADAYGRLTPRDMTLTPRAAYARDSRLSYLKFITGDTQAAVALMRTAVGEGVEAQLPSENLAWLYYELGEYEAQDGNVAAADTAYLTALNTHPGDYRALAGLAKLRANYGRYAEAITLYQKAIAIVPMPIFIAGLGDLYAKTGKQSEADKQYALVEYIGLLGHINKVLHNRDLAIFYADHDKKLSEALELAHKELEVRHDVYTWDAVAWALYKNGKLSEAAEASRKATQFGTRDALLLFHSAIIAEAMGQRDRARSAFEEALQINPHFDPVNAERAKQELVALETQTASNGGLK